MEDKRMDPEYTSQIAEVIGLYLKQRNWGKGEFDEREGIEQTLPQMAFERVLEQKYSSMDLIGYGSIVYNLACADEQYRKILIFIDEAPELYKQQLTQFVFPTFIHFYIELVMNGKIEDAETFWRRFVYTFWILDGFKDLMLDLKELTSASDIMNHDYFSMFRSKKYVIRMSRECSEYFIQFLNQLNHTIMLQFLNLYFEIIDSFSSDWVPFFPTITCEPEVEDEGEEVENKEENEDDKRNSSNGISDKLRNIIKKVYEMPPLPPSIYLYSVINASNMCCADLSYDRRILAGGFNDSGVYLWQFLPLWSMQDCIEKDKIKKEKFETKTTILRGHTSTVYDVAFTPVDNLLFSCSEDRTVRAWTMDNFELAGIYVGHHRPIWSVAASPKGNYFATASRDLKACLWTVDRKFPLSVFVGHELDVNCVKFHPNCNYIVTGSKDSTIRLWSAERKNMVRMFVGHRGNIFALAFSSDGKFLASAGEDLKINIWDLASSDILKTFPCDIDMIHCLSFSTDGKILAAAGLKNTIRLYYMDESLNLSVSQNPKTSGHDKVDDYLSEFHSYNSNFHLLRFCPKNLLLAVGLSNGLM